MQQESSYAVPRSALLFMAAVEEARSTSEGPFRAIAPIFKIALEPQRGQIFDLARAASRLQPILGDGFTQHALEAFVPALTKLGWLAEKKVGNQAAYVVSDSLDQTNEDEAIEESTARLDRLHERFITFMGDHAPLLNMTFTKDEFHWKLFQWATSLDGSDKDAIKSEAERILSGEKPKIKFAFLDETHRFSAVESSLNVEFAGFVKWLHSNSVDDFHDVAALTELGLAYEFLDQLQHPSGFADGPLDVAFVLDAPVILDVLGLSGPGRKASIGTCISALSSRGAKFVTLPHCLEELTEVLETILGRHSSQRFGLTGDAMRGNPSLVSLARTVAARPDQAVKQCGITVLPFKRDDPLNAEYFPISLIDEFRHRATWHDLSKSSQKERDALSVAYVARRRKGNFSSELFENNYTLVTRNSTFTSFSSKFMIKYLSAPEYAQGPAIETKTLAATVWIRFGSLAQTDLPQLHLISACDRILASNRLLLKKAFKKIEEGKDQDSALTLLNSQQAVLDLVIGTGASVEVLDASDASTLLDTMMSTARTEGREEERALAEKILAEEQKKIHEIEEKVEKAERRNIETSTEVERLRVLARNLENAQIDKINSTASAIFEKSDRRSHAVCVMLFVLVGLFSLYGQFLLWSGGSWLSSHPALGSAIIFSSILTFLLGVSFIPSSPNLFMSLKVGLRNVIAASFVKKIHAVEDRNAVSDVLDSLKGS